jgi:hypothetical protein
VCFPGVADETLTHRHTAGAISWTSRNVRTSQAHQVPPCVALMWHNNSMSRVRVSTTVDEELLGHARRLRSQLTDSALLDEALGALVARHRATEIDTAYGVYERHPLDEPDEWGDLASFRDSAGAS